jgi:hypothetical protein
MTLSHRLLATKLGLIINVLAAMLFSSMAASLGRPEEFGLLFISSFTLSILHSIESPIITVAVNRLADCRSQDSISFRNFFLFFISPAFSVILPCAIILLGSSISGYNEILLCAVLIGAARPLANINIAILCARSFHGTCALITSTAALIPPSLLYILHGFVEKDTPQLFIVSAAAAAVEVLLLSVAVKHCIGRPQSTKLKQQFADAIALIRDQRESIARILVGGSSWTLASNIDKIVLSHTMDATSFGQISVGLAIFGFCMSLMAASLSFQGEIHSNSDENRKIRFEEISTLSMGYLFCIVGPLLTMGDLALTAWTGRVGSLAAPILSQYLMATFPTGIAALLFTLQASTGQLVHYRLNSIYLLSVVTPAVGLAAWAYGPGAAGLTFSATMLLWLPVVGRPIYSLFWPGEFTRYVLKITVSCVLPSLGISLLASALWPHLNRAQERWVCLVYLGIVTTLCAMTYLITSRLRNRLNMRAVKEAP